jgi:hypothetical protein
MNNKIARYTVIFDRVIGSEEDTGSDELTATLEPKEGVKQLVNELQESYDQGYIAGNFSIVKREVINESDPCCSTLPKSYA